MHSSWVAEPVQIRVVWLQGRSLVAHLPSCPYVPWVQESLLLCSFFFMPIQLVSVAVHANLCTKSGNNNVFARVPQQKLGAIPSKD